MATTVVHLEADIVEVDEQPRYRLYASCTAQGDLQDAFMFLMEIVDPEIPGNDVFERVLNVTDLDESIGFPSNRDGAIANGKNFYRANEFTKYYTDVEVAANAKQVLQDEVNRYVNEYVTYSSQFKTTGGEDVSFPTADEATADALKTAYDTALTAYNTALTTQQAATVALTAAEDEYDETVAWVAKRDDLDADLDDRAAEMLQSQHLYDAFLSTATGKAKWFRTEVADFINAYDVLYPTGVVGPMDSERDALEAAAQTFLENITTALSADVNGTILTGVNNHNSIAGNPDQYYISEGANLDADLLTKQNAVTTAQTAKVIADADVTAKYDLVEAAYSAAKAVCPDWTPDTPLPARPST